MTFNRKGQAMTTKRQESEFLFDVYYGDKAIGVCNTDDNGNVSEVEYYQKDERFGCVCPKCPKCHKVSSLTLYPKELYTDCCGVLNIELESNI